MPSTTTEPEKQQQWTGRVLFLCALLELLLVHLAYRVDRAKRAPLISTASWAIGFGVALGGVLSYLSPDRASREGLDPQLLFFGLLPPIVLEAGFNTQRKGFFSNFLAICLLAVVGTLVATLATGALVYWMGTIGSLDVTALPLAEAMLYGALVSAIDPVATLVVLKKSRAPPLLFNLLFGESVLNDAIVIVVFGIVQHAVLDASGGEWWSVGVAATLLLQLVSISIGSVLLAAAICYSSAFCLRHADEALKQHPTYEIATLLLSAYASYVVGESLQLSGLLAVFSSGVLIRHYHFYSVSHAGAAAFTHMLATAAFLAENLIYLYLGASLVAYSNSFQWDWTFIGLSLAAMLVARALSTFPLCALANLWRTQRIPWRYMVVLWFAGLRGSIAFALALNVRTQRDDHASVIRASTLVAVLLTTVLFGAATGPLLDALGLATRDRSTPPATPPRPFHDETTPLLLATTTLTDVATATTDTGLSPRRNDEHEDARWTMRRLWVHVDERHLKPIFGGKPRVPFA